MMESLRAPTVRVGDSLARDHFTKDITQHLKSRRIVRGERLEFLNGAGLRALCECEDVPSQRYRVVSVTEEPALNPRIELFIALPKGDALGETITQATEIGIAKIVFLKTEHAQIPKELTTPPLARAQRIADASCEQCSRAWRLEVQPDWTTFEDALKIDDFGTATVVADEALAEQNVLGFRDPPPDGTTKYRLFVGPEGGWSERERQLFDGSSIHRLGLGSHILRMPTATVAAAFYLRALRKS